MTNFVYLIEHFFEIDGEETCNFCGCYIDYDNALKSMDSELDNIGDITITSYLCVDENTAEDNTVVFEIRFLLRESIESIKITKTCDEFYVTIWGSK